MLAKPKESAPPLIGQSVLQMALHKELHSRTSYRSYKPRVSKQAIDWKLKSEPRLKKKSWSNTLLRFKDISAVLNEGELVETIIRKAILRVPGPDRSSAQYS